MGKKIEPKFNLEQYNAVTAVVHGEAIKTGSDILFEAYNEIERAYSVFFDECQQHRQPLKAAKFYHKG